MKVKMIAPCLFGLEGIVADELRRLHMDHVAAENGRVLFSGSEKDIPRANLNLRCAERVLIEMGRFPASDFDALFEGVKALSWEEYIPKNGSFPVKGFSLDSKLRSIPGCQKIIKRAIVERLKLKYGLNWFPEDGAVYQVQFSIMKDQAVLSLDTSGAGLHKRGWRAQGVAAPLRETLAAGMVHLSRYRGKEPFCDPFCGSGTIVIEAALAALNRAPGLGRSFAAQSWDRISSNLWTEAAQEARAGEFQREYDIWGGDLDPRAISIARSNAQKAGVSDLVRFERKDASDFARLDSGGVIVTNPPYGERMLELREAELLYQKFGAAYAKLDRWRLYLLSAHAMFESGFGKKADKKRKLYNGMIKCDLFMYR
ncbi:MAG: class I SAM-dependent RNA methyltransferase [Oscillospiraceae bacterium]|nr:class I SAM-dependent RNA methyltransferase [Oscillospiraceae bacterium]